jgi:sugar lactone lactonase YvrE
MLSRRCTIPAAATFAALLAGCGGSSVPAPTAASSAAQAPLSYEAQPQTAANALYVSDTVGKSVFRFVLNSNGTLQTPAGSSLVLPYNPFAIAIQGKNLYVTNQVNNSVQVYTAGATGSAKAKRSVLLAFEPTAVAVDKNGFLFVGGSTNGFVAVFAPGAKGIASPLQEIALPDRHPTINGVAVDADGNLYMSDTNEVSEFTTPTTNPTLFRAIIGSGQQNIPSGIAIDPSEEAYVANTGSGNVLAYSSTANGTSAPDRVLSSASAPLRGPIGDAVHGNEVYVTSGTQAFGPPSVFVFNKKKGAQTPLQVVTGQYLAAPVGAAIGP